MRQRITPLKQRHRLYAGRLRLERHRHSVWVKLQRVKHGARDSLRSIVNHSVSTVPFESTLYFTSCTFARVFVSTNLFVVNLEDIIVGRDPRAFRFALRTFSPLFPRPARARDRPSPPTGRPPTFILPVFLRPVVVAFAVVIVDVTVRLDDAEAHERDPIGVIALSHARTQSVVCLSSSLSLCAWWRLNGRTDGRTYTVRRRRRVLSLLLVPTRETEDRLDSQ